MCNRCTADPQPANFGSPRRCAFNPDGSFNKDNWNCATISALLNLEHCVEHYGDDESMQVVTVPSPPDPDALVHFCTDGWIILTRYKYRGETSGAHHVMWSGLVEPLTLELAERTLSLEAEVKASSSAND